MILGITSLLCYFTLTNNLSWANDDSAYIMQAKSITEGNTSSFIELNRFTNQQSSFRLGPIAYPWGFPTLIAPFYAVFGLNVFALKSVSVASFLLFILALWFGFRRYHTDNLLVILACLFALNPTFIAFTDNILSDLPFLLFSTVSIILISRIVIDERVIVSKLWDDILLGVVIAGAFLIRTNGLLLLVTLALAQIVSLNSKHKTEGVKTTICRVTITNLKSMASYTFFREVITLLLKLMQVFIPHFVFLCVVSLLAIILPEGGSSHLSIIKVITPSIIKQNLIYYVSLPANFFYGTSSDDLLYCLSIPFCVLGILKRFKQDYHVVIYGILTLLLYVLWPAKQGLRFLFPIIPFYCSFVLTGLNVFQGDIVIYQQRLLKKLFFLPVILIIFLFGIRSVHNAYDNSISNREILTGPLSESSIKMFEFIKNNTETRSVVIFFDARVMSMMTARKSIVINSVERFSSGDYLCLHLKMGTYGQVSPSLLTGMKNVRPIYKNDDFIVYRIKDVLTDLQIS